MLDPIHFRAGEDNLYRYVRNQPTLTADPTGQDPLVYAILAEGVTGKMGPDPAGSLALTSGSLALANIKKDPLLPAVVMGVSCLLSGAWTIGIIATRGKAISSLAKVLGYVAVWGVCFGSTKLVITYVKTGSW